jgi:hypothetical protein
MGVTAVAAYVTRRDPPPGRLAVVPLDVLEVLPDGLRVPGLTVVDVRGGSVLSGRGRLRSDPGRGGGDPLQPELDTTARAFSLTNVAWSARRLLQRAETYLGAPLPPLLILIGRHESDRRRWGGGHYRLPASSYSELPEESPVAPTGEVHLGSGRAYVGNGGAHYLHAPGHNVALVTHEVAHHICRHVADFRLNGLRPSLEQTNRRTAVEEGTCDYLAAAMIGHPDIYAWHRGHLPVTDPRRRSLSSPWTMADFQGGHDADPHADGSIWAGALWDARSRAAQAGHRAEHVDMVLIRGLARLGREHGPDRNPETRRARKYFGTLLSAMLEAAAGAALAEHLEGAMAARGIHAGWSNAHARDVARGLA